MGRFYKSRAILVEALERRALLSSAFGTVFHDANGDGVIGAFEPPLAGVPVTIYSDYNLNGAPDPNEPQVITPISGSYELPNLPAGVHNIRAAFPAGYTGSFPASGTYQLDIDPQFSKINVNFAGYTTGRISGYTFEDTDGNGGRNNNEQLLSGRTVYVDLNKNGAFDSGEPSVSTSSTGVFRFDLSPGDYQVRQVLPTDWAKTIPTSGQPISITVESRVDTIPQPLGSRLTTGKVSGIVFTDFNPNGARDSGESLLSHHTVYVDANDNAVRDAGEKFAVTDDAGAYSFTLPIGQYRIRQELFPNWQETFPAGGIGYSVSVISNQTVAGKSFGTRIPGGGAVSGTVFEDRAADGTKSTGDPGIAGRIVYVDTNDNGQLDGAETYTFTDINGLYTITGVTPGATIVRDVLPADWIRIDPTAGFRSVLVAVNQNASNLNFAEFKLITATGIVYDDRNANGRRDIDELGLSGFRLYLDTNTNAAYDVGEPTAITDARGVYSILTERRNSTLRLVNQTGWIAGIGSSGYSGLSSGGVLRTDSPQKGASFIRGRIVVGDANGAGTSRGLGLRTVFLDLDNNGALDATDPRTLTDDFGFYSFGQLALGTYTVRPVVPTFYTLTSAAFATVNVISPLASYSPSAFVMTTTVPTGGIYGRAFYDSDGDGTFDPEELPLVGRTIFADANSNSVPDTGEATAVTDSSGFYGFNELAVGRLLIRQILPANWIQTVPADNAGRDLTISSGGTSGETVYLQNDFGSQPLPGSIAGTVFYDQDGDGQQDAGESGNSGVVVYLDANNNAQLDSDEQSFATSASGAYQFAGLTPGTYTIRQVLGTNIIQTFPGASGAQVVNVGAGENVIGKDFGRYIQTFFFGKVYNDLNRSGGRDLNEPGLAGRTVFIDANANNALDAAEQTAVTDANGDFVLAVPANNTYRIVQILPTGWSQTQPSAQPFYFENATIGGNFNVIFGAAAPITEGQAPFKGTPFVVNSSGSARIEAEDFDLGGEGVAYHDTDSSNNGGQYRKTEGVDLSATADAGGGYRVSYVRAGEWLEYSLDVQQAGTYPLRVRVGSPGVGGKFHFELDGQPITSSITAPSTGGFDTMGTINAGDVALPAGQHVLRLFMETVSTATNNTANFNYLQFGALTTIVNGSISGNLFNDTDVDGIRDIAEAGLAGRTAFIDSDNDRNLDIGEKSTTTDASGNYSFTDLAPGLYVIRQVRPTNWNQTAPADAHTIQLASAQNITSRDFGSVDSATIGRIAGFVYDDVNGDGILQAGENALLPDRTVYIDANNNAQLDAGETSFVTKLDGYWFENLLPGSYTIRTIVPAGWQQTAPASNGPQIVTVAAGQRFFGANFGTKKVVVTDGQAPFKGTPFVVSAAGSARIEAEDFDLGGEGVAYHDTDSANNGGQYRKSEGVDLSATADAGGGFRISYVRAGEWLEYSIDVTEAGTYPLMVRLGSPSVGGNFHFEIDGQNVTGALTAPSTGSFDTMTTFNAGNVALTAGPHILRLSLDTVASSSNNTANFNWLQFGPKVSTTTGLISGTVFQDNNNNLRFDTGDTAIVGRTIFIDANNNGALDAGETRMTSQAGGAYQFANLPAGFYVVRQILPANWAQTTPTEGASFAVAAGQNTVVDFGSFNPTIGGNGTISGTLYNDLNGNGTRDLNEPGLSNWRVYLDQNKNTLFDTGEQSTFTDTSGNYTFSLPAGSYRVRQFLQSGWRRTNPSGWIDVALPAGGSTSNINFAQTQKVLISGSVFSDADGDGVKDTGETVLTNWRIFIDANNDGAWQNTEKSVLSEASGNWSFKDLPAGTYAVRIQQQTGYTRTTPATGVYTLTLSSGSTSTGKLFGEKKIG